MITNDLFNELLVKPSKSNNKLKIISGYASPAMANKHIKEISKDISIELIIGMIPFDGIGIGGHKGFKTLSTDIVNFNCNYVINPPPVHIKSYIWLENEKPKLAFTGSGNYSQNAFFGRTKESFSFDDPNQCNELYESLKSNTINCLDNEIEAKVTFYNEIYSTNRGREYEDSTINRDFSERIKNKNSQILSLLSTKDGETHKRSGLNWGQRNGREKNQAYIPVPSNIAKSGFFPNRANHFTLITDDGESFDCVIAQDGDKAIHTTKNNSLLGAYFRERIGQPLESYIKKEHLDIYGRTDVEITRIDDETYFMDFSVK